jgi:1-deoxy-D-xylulose-5-phosphate reductoisomerase
MAGSTFPAVMNAANEVAVMAFLDGRIPLTRIGDVVEAVVAEHEAAPVVAVVGLQRADAWARRRAAALLDERPAP